MKRRPVLPFLFIVLAVALFAAHSTAQALPPVPPDCSDTLSESEITAVAQYMIYDPDSEDPDWASCAATFNHTANDDALFAELDELGWTPEATPEGDIYPPDATPFPDENDLDQASLPPVDLSWSLYRIADYPSTPHYPPIPTSMSTNAPTVIHIAGSRSLKRDIRPRRARLVTTVLHHPIVRRLRPSVTVIPISIGAARIGQVKPSMTPTQLVSTLMAASSRISGCRTPALTGTPTAR